MEWEDGNHDADADVDVDADFDYDGDEDVVGLDIGHSEAEFWLVGKDDIKGADHPEGDDGKAKRDREQEDDGHEDHGAKRARGDGRGKGKRKAVPAEEVLWLPEPVPITVDDTTRPGIKNAKPHLEVERHPGHSADMDAHLEWLSDRGNSQQLLQAALAANGSMTFIKKSFDFFLQRLAPDIISEATYLVQTCGALRHEFFISPDLHYSQPEFRHDLGSVVELTPAYCKQRNQNYQIYVMTHVQYRLSEFLEGEWRVIREEVQHDFTLWEQPLLVGSTFAPPCPDEPGGYFIVRPKNGRTVSEKTLQNVQRLQTNHPMVSSPEPGKYTAEVRSIRESKVRSTSTLYMDASVTAFDWAITLRLPFVKTNIPLRFILFALGVPEGEFTRMIADIGGHEHAQNKKFVSTCGLISSLERITAEDPCRTLDEMYAHIADKGCEESGYGSGNVADHVHHILTFEFLPHLGEDMDETTRRAKAYFLAKMCFRIIRVHLGLSPPDNRDLMHFVRMEGCGYLLALLLRQCFRNYTKSIQRVWRKNDGQNRTLTIDQFVNRKYITTILQTNITTGAWTTRPRAATQNGLTLPVNTQNRVAFASYARRALKLVNRDGKNAGPRQLPQDAWGLLCPAETPEGNAWYGSSLLFSVGLLSF